MLAAIAELSRVRPHVWSQARHTAPEHDAYEEGYYRALSIALQVAQGAKDRFKLRVATLRAETRAKRRV